MLIAAIKPGHDGSLAIVENNRLIYSLEAEKDSLFRYSELGAARLFDLMELTDRTPDILAVGGWFKGPGRGDVGAGYYGPNDLKSGRVTLWGQKMEYFTSTHERSHIMMAMGMAPPDDSPLTAVLVWEGAFGAFYLVDQDCTVVKTVNVLEQPGQRYGFLFDLADPVVREPQYPRLGSSGKLMALAAYGNAADADDDVVACVDRILDDPRPGWWPNGDAKHRISFDTKQEFSDSALFNIGVEDERTKTAAALLSDRIFSMFADAARKHLPAGIPLRISGGCGLNCDWNRHWRDLGHFSSVFVPPVTNDSGSAIGTAADAALFHAGNGTIEWDVYAGLDFARDVAPNPAVWTRRPLDNHRVAQNILNGTITAWVQGRWEMGPRSLGNRSLLASPFDAASRDRLNEIKQREHYRPIAPCCREEDLAELFDETFPDPHMLYFRRVISSRIPAVTHVDGTARVQTVSADNNFELHKLLSSVAEVTGSGVLCNTSLNWPGYGFINRMSDLLRYCEQRGIEQIVVGDDWYTRTEGSE